MNAPDLETPVMDGEAFRIWTHGYPYRTVRWHFHPEFEIHLVTETSGRAFVGDYVGAFAPGNLVMTGPDLPHNWVSDVAPGTVIDRRCIVLQFTRGFLDGCSAMFPMLDLPSLALDAKAGVEFSAETSRAVDPLMRQMCDGEARARPALLLRILDLLGRDSGRRTLASAGYRSEPARYRQTPLNRVLDHIAVNFEHDVREADLAQRCGVTVSAFSRLFHRHTGMSLPAYVNTLRINRACQLLADTAQSITDICFSVGFNNVSNFNRTFRVLKGMTPRAYRVCQRQNSACARTWNHDGQEAMAP
ncbi:AraC family transcriptional regulator [Ameyamaea chiangmaiensis NBRC 103196]|uniref:AraC family transcriptional regulator n=1 Tax=Ameyamaea chiangmaiensis TaxID=442969 RepID=A0A850PFN7_9PROT|nr:AraC family transcriptional regulator [Ameyamaea chiangmaiensis]MBS4074130.1 AraC family transcriptional regulator [Ameyamaea chiangmaiensis]NVN39941.1 AraC family transcriptional regulator [Ameyamaea chiangmaiensis]GBQ70982.1 AraC family transcriptional regulator [Ameyamaea chiangmaiensis NBRC 103196]